MDDAAARLEEPVTLADIIDPDSLQRVCLTFSRLYRTGVAVLDAKGAVLVDVPAEHVLCRRVSSRPQGQDILCAFDNLVGGNDDSSPCLCGLQYRMAPIVHQGQALGRVVFGPFRPEGLSQLPDALLEKLEVQDDSDSKYRASIAGDLERLRELSPADIEQALGAINEILAVIVQTGYARHLTSQIHIAAIQDAYNELTEKNRRLADSVEKLKDLDKLKSSFLATVSHELRTPLTSVIGYSEMLLEGLAGALSSEQTDYIKTIMDKGEHLLKLINEVLDVSRIESGNVQLSLEQFDISDLVRQVADAMMPQAKQKSLDLTYEIAQGLRPLMADRVKTRQILINLVNNAIKFTPAGGHVIIDAVNGHVDTAGRRVPAVNVNVRDSGIGIPAESREKIFEAFFQVDSSSTRVHGGTGLGLSIVKHFVEAHGGRVWVEGPENADGSVFIVQFPLTPPKHLRSRHLVGA